MDVNRENLLIITADNLRVALEQVEAIQPDLNEQCMVTSEQ
jgi:hypothetical protein